MVRARARVYINMRVRVYVAEKALGERFFFELLLQNRRKYLYLCQSSFVTQFIGIMLSVTKHNPNCVNKNLPSSLTSLLYV